MKKNKRALSLPMTGSRLELMIQDFRAKLISRLGPWSSPPKTSMTDSDILAKKLAKHEKGHHLNKIIEWGKEKEKEKEKRKRKKAKKPLKMRLLLKDQVIAPCQ